MLLTQKWVSRSQKKSKYILMWNNTVNNDFTMNSQYSILLWNNTGNYCEILVTFFFFPFYDWIRYLPHHPIQSTSNTVGCSSGDNNNSRPLTRPLQASLWLVSGISTCSVFLSASCVPSFQPATDLGQWQTPPRASAVLMPLCFSLPERPCSHRALHPISWGREKVKKGEVGGWGGQEGVGSCDTRWHEWMQAVSVGSADSVGLTVCQSMISRFPSITQSFSPLYSLFLGPHCQHMLKPWRASVWIAHAPNLPLPPTLSESNTPRQQVVHILKCCSKTIDRASRSAVGSSAPTAWKELLIFHYWTEAGRLNNRSCLTG